MRAPKPRHAFSIFISQVIILLTLGGAICAATDRPNILWITSEDHGPHLGAYGDDYADTPNLDALARRGMLYRNAWSTAPVCAPARTTIISGVYPPSSGAHHMRSMVRLPASMKLYPQYLREAGYYCTNNAKEDYNVEKPSRVWDESSRGAHWRKRSAEQPFFSVFNFTQTHESQIRKRPHKLKHDPAKVRVPAYHPDTPEVRLDWAQYHDKVSEVDALAGRLLADLAADGLTEDTIVFFYADHGPGMPRSKRWTYNSGLHVPLIVYVPEQYRDLAGPSYKPGGESDRLVGFIDLAPTVLSLAGIQPPVHFQGGAFLGPHAVSAPEYQFAFRDRMDERYDMTRAVRDRRYIYIRNYKPHKLYGQHVAYMFQTPTTRVWHSLFQAGKLNAAQSHFWKTKPAEELYDLEADPDEIRNLADSMRGRRSRAVCAKCSVRGRAGFATSVFCPRRDSQPRAWHDPVRSRSSLGALPLRNNRANGRHSLVTQRRGRSRTGERFAGLRQRPSLLGGAGNSDEGARSRRPLARRSARGPGRPVALRSNGGGPCARTVRR